MAETKVTRNSKQRTAILQVLAGTTSHPTADWVYQEVSRLIPNISLGTVYRNLSHLAEAGTIQRMEIGDGTDHFDYNTEPHDHFYCRKCQRLYDFPLPYNKAMDKQAADTGYGLIEQHSLIYRGVCKGCLDVKKLCDCIEQKKSGISLKRDTALERLNRTCVVPYYDNDEDAKNEMRANFKDEKFYKQYDVFVIADAEKFVDDEMTDIIKSHPEKYWLLCTYKLLDGLVSPYDICELRCEEGTHYWNVFTPCVPVT